MSSKLNFDPNILKEEMRRKREEKGQQSGGNADNFLNELLESRKTGRPTKAVNRIKKIENESIKHSNQKYNKGDKPIFNEADESTPEPTRRKARTVDFSDDNREEQMFRDFESSNNQTLAEQMEKFNQKGSSLPHHTQQPQSRGGDGLQTRYLHETVDEYMTKNYAPLIENSIKNVMLETYAVETIKKALLENKDLLKAAVIEVIKDLKRKKTE